MGYLLDAFVILAYFGLVIGVGLASSRKRGQNMREYAVGSRQLPWWAVLGSLIAAELSAATFLGTPGEGYHLRNFTYAQLAVGVIPRAHRRRVPFHPPLLRQQRRLDLRVPCSSVLARRRATRPRRCSC